MDGHPGGAGLVNYSNSGTDFNKKKRTRIYWLRGLDWFTISTQGLIHLFAFASSSFVFEGSGALFLLSQALLTPLSSNLITGRAARWRHDPSKQTECSQSAHSAGTENQQQNWWVRLSSVLLNWLPSCLATTLGSVETKRRNSLLPSNTNVDFCTQSRMCFTQILYLFLETDHLSCSFSLLCQPVE